MPGHFGDSGAVMAVTHHRATLRKSGMYCGHCRYPSEVAVVSARPAAVFDAGAAPSPPGPPPLQPPETMDIALCESVRPPPITHSRPTTHWTCLSGFSHTIPSNGLAGPRRRQFQHCARGLPPRQRHRRAVKKVCIGQPCGETSNSGAISADRKTGRNARLAV